MVSVEHHMTQIALKDGMLPFREAAKPLLVISRLMAFNVRLRTHIDAVPVAEIVPEMMIRIVAGTDRVDIVKLHKLNIANHKIQRNRASVFGICFMTIDTLHLDGPAVHVKCITDDLLLLKADLLGSDIFTGLHDERVKIRLFRAPEVDALKLHVPYQLRAGLLRGSGVEIENLPALGIVKRGSCGFLISVHKKLQ